MIGDDTDSELLALARAMAEPDHEVKRTTSEWAREHLGIHDRVAADRDAAFAEADWQRCADRGIFRVTVPTDRGGTYSDLATALLTLEGLGHGSRDNGLSYAIGSQMLSTQDALAKFGSDTQCAEWLEPLLSGAKLGAFAMTEPEVGSDAYSIATTADLRSDGSYTINGHKAYITFASRCDMVIVFAVTSPDAGAWGLSAFIVPTDLPGVERLGNRDKMGMRTTPFGDVTFTDVTVPPSALLGREGAGASIFNSVVQFERAFVFATQVGAMQRQLEAAIDYARSREQGGQPIGRYQAIAHRVVDMRQQLEAARLFVYRAGLAAVTGRDVATTAALAKVVGAESGIAASMAAVSIHGATGYVSEFEVERELRDALGGLVYSGTSDIQRNIIARLLGIGH